MLIISIRQTEISWYCPFHFVLNLVAKRQDVHYSTTTNLRKRSLHEPKNILILPLHMYCSTIILYNVHSTVKLYDTYCWLIKDRTKKLSWNSRKFGFQWTEQFFEVCEIFSRKQRRNFFATILAMLIFVQILVQHCRCQYMYNRSFLY